LIPVVGYADIPGTRLVIVHHATQWAALEDLSARVSAGNVLFTGFPADAGDLCALFDSSVRVSNDEPYGLATLEAADSGVPVVPPTTRGVRMIAGRLPIHLVSIGSTEEREAGLRPGAAREIPYPAITGYGTKVRLRELYTIYDRLVALGHIDRTSVKAAPGGDGAIYSHIPPA
jgi:glycosyltransferase involved in cell wall biosynthesis